MDTLIELVFDTFMFLGAFATLWVLSWCLILAKFWYLLLTPVYIGTIGALVRKRPIFILVGFAVFLQWSAIISLLILTELAKGLN